MFLQTKEPLTKMCLKPERSPIGIFNFSASLIIVQQLKPTFEVTSFWTGKLWAWSKTSNVLVSCFKNAFKFEAVEYINYWKSYLKWFSEDKKIHSLVLNYCKFFKAIISEDCSDDLTITWFVLNLLRVCKILLLNVVANT